MGYKKIMMLTIILTFLLAVSVVSAAENVTDDVVSTNAVSDDVVGVEETTDEVVVWKNDNQVISEGNASAGNFTELRTEINNLEEGGVLNLTKDYKFCVRDVDLDIKKSITIDGQGHTLYGSNIRSYFYLDNLIFKNTIFYNYALQITGSNNNIINSTFIDTGYDGIGLRYGSNNSIINSTFINSTVSSYEGSNISIINSTFINYTDTMNSVIHLRGSNICIINLTFINNTATRLYAIYIRGSNNSIINSTFINNSVNWGGVISLYVGSNNSIINSTFINNTSDWGGAIYIGSNTDIKNNNIINSTFINNRAVKGGAIYMSGANNHIFNCSFINNHADFGGAIFLQPYGGPHTVINSTFIKNTAKYCGGAAHIVTNEYSNTLKNLYYDGNAAYKGKNIYNYLVDSGWTMKPKIEVSNLKVTYSDGSCYTVQIYSSDGIFEKNTIIYYRINNGKRMEMQSNDYGIAKFKVTQAPGTYKVYFEFSGISLTKTLTVTHLVTLKSVSVKKSAKSLVLQANLGKVAGKYLIKKTVTFKFNGKTYTAKTNSKGVAKVTIKSNVLKKLKAGKKVTYQATYLKDTVKKTVVVKK